MVQSVDQHLRYNETDALRAHVCLIPPQDVAQLLIMVSIQY